ncbi:hypothetical protein RV040_004380 [Vibrio alginolyticus]|nr:hypothetical protein [Vibrio alginolyticus]
MARSSWLVAIVFYICTMIAYHRFEDSKYALDILGNIPTFLASLAAVIGGLVALKTYTDSKRKEPSKAAFDAYQECLKSLIEVLTSKEDKTYKLYYTKVCYDTLRKVEPLITQQEHKSLIAVTNNILKHHLDMLLKSYCIADYFCCHKQYEKSFPNTVTGSANALYDYWKEHVRGHSQTYKDSQGEIDSFGAYPFGIDKDFLIKALALYANDRLELNKVTERIEENLQLIETNTRHELIDFADGFPMLTAYLLLKTHTQSYKTENELALGLTCSYDEKY